MSREVRRVPADWQHPIAGQYDDGTVRYTPLFDGNDCLEDEMAEWDRGNALWERGQHPAQQTAGSETYEDYAGARPDPSHYMPCWPAEDATHYMMYETTSEGTPISPLFETPEELAGWLADNDASAFADIGAGYEDWLRVAEGLRAPSAIFVGGAFSPGFTKYTD